MKNFLKITSVIFTISLSSCYTTFSKVDVYSESSTSDSYLSDVSTLTSVLGFAGSLFSSSFLFDDIFTRLLFSSIEYIPYSSPGSYYGYNHYSPYGYGYSYTYISYNYWYYPPHYHNWRSPYYYPVKKEIRYAARKFKKRSTVPVVGKIKRSRSAGIDSGSNKREDDNKNNAFYASSRVKRVRTTKYARTNNSDQTNRVKAPPVKTRSRSVSTTSRSSSKPKSRTKEQNNKKSNKSDSSTKRDNNSNTRTRRR